MEAFNAYIAMAPAGLAVLAIAALVFPLVLTQNRLRATKNELEQVRGGKIKLESVIASLKTEVDLASKARDESEANLNQAHSQIQKLNTELRDA
jgi:septal ring factor EnvC (AmiA/AmiB activator)